MSPITRREALGRLAALTGSAMLGAEFFLSGCSRTDKTLVNGFSPEQFAQMDAIADTIIPPTDCPGAKAAGVGAVMGRIVHDCYSDDEHAAFADGLVRINSLSQSDYRAAFVDCRPVQQLELLSQLDREQLAYSRSEPKPKLPHYFAMMKELTLLGYFSSQIGCTQAQRYIETPGKFQGDVPYHPWDKAWSGGTIRVG